ncbi:MAG: hypothetical protein NT121_20090, partial [Chloroflexi bacterium]|nr:hypothetical protein [Chloroflexota bacterium]
GKAMEFAVVPAPACADPRTISPMVPKKRKKPNHDGRANCKNCNNKILWLLDLGSNQGPTD